VMRKLFTVICFFGWLSMPAVVLGVVKIDLKSEVSVIGKNVMLSDLAEISGEDAPLVSGIAIAKSPDDPFGMYISSWAVKEKVKSRYLGPVVYTGATITHVTSGTVEVAERALEKVFAEEIVKNSPWKNIGKIEVTDVRVSRLPKVLQADANIIQAKFSSHERYLGFVTANMIIGSGPKPEKATVTGKVKLIAEIPVMKENVASGRIITPSDLIVKSCDISTCPNVYTRLEDCVGKRSKVTLLEGNPILPSQVQRKPDICTGELVSIEAKINNLVVRDKGIALKDGYLGETIPVKNASSGRQVVGTIIADSVVQVEL